MNRKNIDSICWFIPVKYLREVARKYLITKYLKDDLEATKTLRCINFVKYKSISKKIKNKIKPNTSEKIDVVIPCHSKDIKILPFCIEGIKANIINNIDKIYVVSKGAKIENICNECNVVFVDESRVLGYEKGGISGWVYQQLLKLSGNIGTNRYYISIDADHLLIKPHTFLTSDNKLVFYQSEECHHPYYSNIKYLLENYEHQELSYVAHKMIFDKQELIKLHKDIEEHYTAQSEDKSNTHKRWDEIIVESVEKHGHTISEFELFGYFVPENQKIHITWNDKSISYKYLSNYKNLLKKYKRYDTLSFHAYLN